MEAERDEKEMERERVKISEESLSFKNKVNQNSLQQRGPKDENTKVEKQHPAGWGTDTT